MEPKENTVYVRSYIQFHVAGVDEMSLQLRDSIILLGELEVVQEGWGPERKGCMVRRELGGQSDHNFCLSTCQ